VTLNVVDNGGDNHDILAATARTTNLLFGKQKKLVSTTKIPQPLFLMTGPSVITRYSISTESPQTLSTNCYPKSHNG